MHRMRKLIHSLHLLNFISFPPQIFQIPGQSRRVTTYVHDPFRLHLYHRSQYALFASFPWRIHHDHIRIDAFFFIFFRQHFFRFSYKEFCIGDMIQRCISFCILDGSRDNFHTIDLFCFLGEEEGNCSDSAVEIPDRLISFQTCVFQCFFVKFLCLHRIDLVERLRGDLIGDRSDRIGDVFLSP